jgi:hypothetical protein
MHASCARPERRIRDNPKKVVTVEGVGVWLLSTQVPRQYERREVGHICTACDHFASPLLADAYACSSGLLRRCAARVTFVRSVRAWLRCPPLACAALHCRPAGRGVVLTLVVCCRLHHAPPAVSSPLSPQGFNTLLRCPRHCSTHDPWLRP